MLFFIHHYLVIEEHFKSKIFPRVIIKFELKQNYKEQKNILLNFLNFTFCLK